MSTIRTARKARKLTLQQLADNAGISKSYLWELEQGQTTPNLNIAYSISAALQVSVYDLWLDMSGIEEINREEAANKLRAEGLKLLINGVSVYDCPLHRKMRAKGLDKEAIDEAISIVKAQIRKLEGR